MRPAARISRTAAEWADAQAAERARICDEVIAIFAEAKASHAPWYEWIKARREGRHLHELKDDAGRLVACPVPGCSAVAGQRRRKRVEQSSPAATGGELHTQMELVA